jgi:hypothetical protein
MNKFIITLVLLSVFFNSYVLADIDSPVPLASQNDRYQGYLGYQDYRSGKNVSIPLTLTFTQSSDNKYLVVDKVFTDPGYKVYSMSVIRLDLGSKTLVETTFENNKSVEYAYDITDFTYNNADSWSITRRGLKSDDNQDARVTITEKLEEGVFTSETRVDYLATAANENLRRNWVEAKLSEGATK